MTDLPLKVGAALMIEDLPTYRRWLIEGQRDLEVQDFLEPDLFAWRLARDRRQGKAAA